ncbi:MAG TPA: hypothetical protein DC047_20290 [Blastocatellia bacterium]|nr:hypothetical protein [Blastocatellia bacterium]
MPLELKIGLDAITSYKRLSYTPWHAIAEFVDNSTQNYFDHKVELDAAWASNKETLNVSIVYEKDLDGGFLRVSDNALGMSYEELERALHVALPPANTSGRSKYGMGLKTSACWIGNEWTVKTKRLGETVEHSITVNVEKIASGENELPYTRIEGRPAEDHYTIVEIKNHNQKFHGRTQGKIKDFLRSMYREDFRNNVLTLEWQGSTLSWEELDDKLLDAADGSKYKKNFDFLVDGKRVYGWVGILRRGSRADAGFSVIHFGRVIKGWPDSWRPQKLYGQLQGSNDLVNQRLVGEIHLDEFDVTHTKDDILWLGDQEEEVEKGLLANCANYKEYAKEYRKSQDDQRGPNELETSAAIDELKKELMSPEMVDEIQLDESLPPKEVIAEAVGRITRSVVETRVETLRADVGGIAVKLYIDGDMSPNDPYVLTDSTRSSEIVVIVNTAHPYWGQIEGTEGALNYFRHCTYDAIAEWQAHRKSSALDPNTIKLLKDRLLRVPFKIEEHAGEERPTSSQVVDDPSSSVN